MKPVIYLPLMGFIVGVLALELSDSAGKVSDSSANYGLLISIAIGIVLGIAYQRRKSYLVLRPIQYWPLVCVVAAVLIPKKDISEDWYLRYPLAALAGLAFGFVIERFFSKRNTQSVNPARLKKFWGWTAAMLTTLAWFFMMVSIPNLHFGRPTDDSVQNFLVIAFSILSAVSLTSSILLIRSK